MTEASSDTKATKLSIEYLTLDEVRPDPRNARRHSAKQLAKLKSSIAAFDFCNPLLIDEERKVIAGHGRLEAVRSLGWPRIPCVRLSHLSAAQKRALAIADNRMSDLSDFDGRKLRETLQELVGLDFEIELTGFDTAEIDIIIDGATTIEADPDDVWVEPTASDPAVSRPGELWALGEHRILCGSALVAEAYARVLRNTPAQIVFTDPPYNVPIDGHVSGLGKHVHREFAMASGEMSEAEFERFLATAMGHMAGHSCDGSIHYLCIDWRHVATMLAAARTVYDEVKNICVWKKSNAGMGSLYRSQHEFVVVAKKGNVPHVNNVQLGRYGRYRTNVWDYAGANAFSATRGKDLAAHPTVKPVALVADAIRDCSRRGGVVLDPFLGSGTTILAAERTGRRAAGIEIDPIYVDTAIRRWQAATRKTAVLVEDGRSFEAVEEARKRGDGLAAPAEAG